MHEMFYTVTVNSLILSINSEAYKEFESRLKELLCNPLEGWLQIPFYQYVIE